MKEGALSLLPIKCRLANRAPARRVDQCDAVERGWIWDPAKLGFDCFLAESLRMLMSLESQFLHL